MNKILSCMVLFALFLQAMYGAVDLLIVGKFAASADVSAVSTGSQIMMTLTNLVSSFAMGTTILLGQQIGALAGVLDQSLLQTPLNLRYQFGGPAPIALHERIRTHSLAAGSRVKDEGKDNDLLERIAADPAFGRYLEEALENHWIDARSMSQRAGGTWCEDLPAYNATAVFSTLPSGTAGAFQFAHPLGVGFMLKLYSLFPGGLL